MLLTGAAIQFDTGAAWSTKALTAALDAAHTLVAGH
jgi:hypothetical protein